MLEDISPLSQRKEVVSSISVPWWRSTSRIELATGAEVFDVSLNFIVTSLPILLTACTIEM
jgi:hypothetical protein